MNKSVAYAINSSKVVSETIEGETIIINLENGNYYSMNESGSFFWGLVQQGATLEDMTVQYLARYDAQASTVEQSLNDLITFLTTEGLIVESEQAASHLDMPTGEKQVFVAPAIERYDDMQEMLLADPIHDVDSVGWPTLKQHS